MCGCGLQFGRDDGVADEDPDFEVVREGASSQVRGADECSLTVDDEELA